MSFKKRAHRPWKTALLESTVQEATLADDDDLFTFDLDLDLETGTYTSFDPEFNFSDDLTVDSSDLDLDLDSRLKLDDEKLEIKQAIKQTKQQHNQIVQQISDKSTNSILLGGFFQPQQISVNNDTASGRTMNSLLTDLKQREQKITSLTSNLKITEATERAEQAEVSKKAASHKLQIAESRMRQAVEQAKEAEEQFLTAMEQTKHAAMAQQEEARLRREAEHLAKEARLRANGAEVELQNERLSRISAEEKAQHAVMLSEKASLFQRQLTETSEQLVRLENLKKLDDQKRIDLQQKYDVLNSEYETLQRNLDQSYETIRKLEFNIKDLSERYKSNEHIVEDFNSQRDKLKAIIAAEQELRKSADRKYHEAAERAEKAEQAWHNEVQQRKLIEERAKRAVANASRTVLHLLNTPGDGDPPIPKEKARIRLPAETDYNDDDLLF